MDAPTLRIDYVTTQLRCAMLQLPARPWYARSAGYHVSAIFGLVLMAVCVAERAHAQRPNISITEPVEWREQPFKALQLAPGRSLRIAGSVTHPASVDRVLVNGK